MSAIQKSSIRESYRTSSRVAVPIRSFKLSAKKLRLGKKRLKDYGKLLLAKQLMRALYNNPREKIFKRYFGKDKSINDVVGNLGRRLEIVVATMGAPEAVISNNHARQLINHGKISVNGHIIKERGFLVKDGDIIVSAVPLQEPPIRLSTASSITREPSFGGKSIGSLGLYIASAKPKKIPKILKLASPISAQILVSAEGAHPEAPVGEIRKSPPILPKAPIGGGSGYADASNLRGDSHAGRNLVNGVAHYAIYYSKEFELQTRNTGNAPSSVATRLGGNTSVGLGWKNTNVKSVKSLLYEISLADKMAKPEDQLRCKIKHCAILYNLVQAYYSRVG